MEIHLDNSGTPQALGALIAKVSALPDVGLVVVLACDQNGFQAEDVDPVLRDCQKPLIGGIFPQLMFGLQHLERGSIVAGLKCRAAVTVVTNLSNCPANIDTALDASDLTLNGQGSTLLIFVDGLSRSIGSLIDSVFNRFGLMVNYLGGGAGSLSLNQSPCILSNTGMVMDAAVLAMTDVVSGIGVAHGWQSVQGPFKVTESDRNTIISLDWEPAFDVYREVVESHSKRKFEKGNFFDLAKAYPFGIARLDSEMVVRDPLILEGSHLICVGEVPTGSYVHVMHGNAKMLLDAAGQALQLSTQAYTGQPGRESLFFIDCISRVLFLGPDFPKEMVAVNTGQPLIGALTLGEIANNGSDFLEFFNKTAVVGLIDA